jgi:hypothetical protein
MDCVKLVTKSVGTHYFIFVGCILLRYIITRQVYLENVGTHYVYDWTTATMQGLFAERQVLIDNADKQN